MLVSDISFKSSQLWLRGLDLNQGPSGYEPDELPDCSTPRRKKLHTIFLNFKDKELFLFILLKIFTYEQI